MGRTVLFTLVAGLPLAAANAQNQDTARAASAEWLNANVAQSSSLQAQNAVSVTGYTHIRMSYNVRDSVPVGEDTAQGFSIPDTTLRFSGSTGDFGYRVSGQFDADGDFSLKDAYAAHAYDNGWTAIAGQLTAPYLRETMLEDTGVLAVGRSVTGETFGANRVQALVGLKTAEQYRFWVAISDGARTRNTDFDSSAEADIAFTTRFEYMFKGADWNAFSDATSFQGSEMSIMAGGAFHYQTGGNTFANNAAGTTADVDVMGLTGDVTLEGNGWSAFGSFVYQSVEPDVGSSTDDMGFVAQGSYFFNETWEGFARYDSIIADAAEDFSTITVGVNKYLIANSQAARFSADVQYFLDEQMGSLASPNNGYVLLQSSNDSQWGLRAQLQLMF